MVRGNWQRRVEQTEARKAVARQRRQKKDNRATFKTMAAHLFAQLDKHRVSTGTIHVWTDTLPSDSPPVGLDPYDFNIDYDDGAKTKRRGRATSFSEATRRDRSGSFNEMQARGRSESFNDSGTPSHNGIHGKVRNSFDAGGSGKKAHPRSKEPEPVEEDSNSFLSLCRAQFFKGKCDSLKLGCKKGLACRHAHYTKHQKTLGEILTLDQNDVLQIAETSLTNAMLDDDEDQVGGIDMMYYFAISMEQANGSNKASEIQNMLCGQILSQTLSSKSCANASVVYVAYENELIFDRYQTGVLVSELGVIFGGVKRVRSTSVISEVSAVSEMSDDALDYVEAEHIPAAVLEFILTFLPDEALTSMTQVCMAWHCEIGKTSSHLWRHMLDRRKWPYPVFEASSSDRSESFFKLHYQVVRDVQAVKSALSTLMNARRGLSDETEMIYQSFSARRTAPAVLNACVAMQVWSPTAVLAAYSHDCTIRLFKTIAKGPTGGRACRELISVCVDPYRKRSRRKARLVAMDIDGDTVGCLLHVLGATLDGDYVLSTISRDDYLEAAGGDSSSLGWSELEEGVLTVTNIGEAVVNNLLSTDDADHHIFRLTDFLANGGNMTDVEVLVSHCLVACGDGRFLIEASISIPDLDGENDDDDDDESPMIMLARKLVVFSSKVGAIVWMGDSNPSQNMIPRRHDLLLSGVCHNDNTMSCSVVAASSHCPTILLFEIDSNGQLSEMRYIEAAETLRSEILSSLPTSARRWELDSRRVRPIVLCPQDVVAVDVFYRSVLNCMEFRSVISFYPRHLNANDVDALPYQVEVLEYCNVLSIERVRDEHLIFLCEELAVPNDTDDIVVDEIELIPLCLKVLILHVPTRQWIDRIRLSMFPPSTDISLSFACVDNTIGVGVGSRGIVMTGADVRAVGRSLDQGGDEDVTTNANNNSAKKKKRIVTKKSTKGRSHRGKGMRC